jgi:hypothetical protein
MLRFLLSFSFIFTPFIYLTALPAQVIIIRHAEKLLTGQNLSQKGKERAAALVPFVLNTREMTLFGPPTAIYATAALKETDSRWTIETVQGLADSLKLTINNRFEVDDYKTMANEIKANPAYAGKTVLICWEHHVIPEIARTLGALQTPARWPAEIFDRVWVISFQAKGKPAFQNLPQRLMFGDSLN